MTFENVYYAPKAPMIRGILHVFADGLTVSQICTKTFIEERVVRQCLKKMPDCYIDRWILGTYQRPPEAIWCAVVVPDHCPRPTKKKQTKILRTCLGGRGYKVLE